MFFDFDGVLALDADGIELICRGLCARIPGLPYDATLECYKRLAIPLLNSGEPHESIWPALCGELKKDIPLDALTASLRDVRPNAAMIEVAKALQPHCRVGILSDNFADRMELIDCDLGLSATFDPIVLSANVHASKFENTPVIYEYALASVGCRPQEAAFIDNAERNLETPARMGMVTYWHDDSKNDVGAVQEFLRPHFPV